ncbi:MAG: signal peptide peptidase SppA [Magnetococcales bacterium]|nr:signal peptide peptidase SppA [Magnetococcales bacterium]
MDKTEPSLQFSEPQTEDALRPSCGSFVPADFLVRLEETRDAERQALERLFLENLRAQRAINRGKNWFRFFIALYLVAILALFVTDSGRGIEIDSLSSSAQHHTAVVDIHGAIMPETEYNAENIIDGLKAAFEDKKSRGVILRINSPGGSPTQAGMIFDEVMRLREKFPSIPVYAFLEDVCASGGYYVAASAKEIYADKATLVGSIGVIMQTFGAKSVLEKLGLESRTLTAGDHKAFMDPFQDLKPEEKSHAQSLLNKIHQQFIGAVRKGRGDRLKASHEKLFSGLFWTGEDAVPLGLIDGLGTDRWIARELIRAERMVNFTHKEDWMTRVTDRLVSTMSATLAWRQGSPWR